MSDVDFDALATLPPEKLTFAAEQLGNVDTDAAAALLVKLLRHESPLVREGAVYGLEKHRHRDNVDMMLCLVAVIDLSPSVRAAAREALE